MCRNFAGKGTATFLCPNEEFTSQAERHVKSHVGDGFYKALKCRGVSHLRFILEIIKQVEQKEVIRSRQHGFT